MPHSRGGPPLLPDPVCQKYSDTVKNWSRITIVFQFTSPPFVWDFVKGFGKIKYNTVNLFDVASVKLW